MSDTGKITGMGAIPHSGGVAFRVWAPHARQVAVVGSFNGWDGNGHAMHAEGNGYWYLDVPEARFGDEYKYLLTTEQGTWRLRFNSDWQGYNEDFRNHPSTDVHAEPEEKDGLPCHVRLSIGPYSVVIFSQ